MSQPPDYEARARKLARQFQERLDAGDSDAVKRYIGKRVQAGQIQPMLDVLVHVEHPQAEAWAQQLQQRLDSDASPRNDAPRSGNRGRYAIAAVLVILLLLAGGALAALVASGTLNLRGQDALVAEARADFIAFCIQEARAELANQVSDFAELVTDEDIEMTCTESINEVFAGNEAAIAFCQQRFDIFEDFDAYGECVDAQAPPPTAGPSALELTSTSISNTNATTAANLDATASAAAGS